MNFTTLLGLIPTILRIVDFIKSTIASGLSLKNIPDIIQNPDILSVFTTLGGIMFPKVDPSLAASAALVATYSPDYVKYVQNAMNQLEAAGLTVDGYYGHLTQNAVSTYQTKKGLKVDGWTGDVTKAAIQADLNALAPATLKAAPATLPTA